VSITPSNDRIVSNLKKETIIHLISKGIRGDGRKLNSYRPISIERGVAKKAEGSALVKIGDTEVIAGVKMSIDKPYEDTPDQGNLIVNVELLPLASPTFEPGPPDENAIEIARTIDRSLRDTKAINLKELCITQSQQVWTTWIDIYVLNHGGNLVDASMLAALAALKDTRVPKVEVKDGKITKTQETFQMPLVRNVVTVTVGKVGNYMIVDPSLEEEDILDSKIVFAITEDEKIGGIQKIFGSLTINELNEAINMVKNSYKQLIDAFKNI
jgi:exosome complex component RRP42